MINFEIGDIVRVKSKNQTGPAMTVERVNDSYTYTVWWDFEARVFKRDGFNYKVLELTDPDTRKVEDPVQTVEEMVEKFFQDVVNEFRVWFK